MKALIIIILLLLHGLVGCKKESNGLPIPDQEVGVVGNWRWINTYSIGFNDTPQSTGQQFSLILKNDSTFSRQGNYFRFISRFPDSTGTFLAYTENSLSVCSGTGLIDRIKFFSPSRPNGAFNSRYWILSNDTLVFDTGSVCDSPISYFVRF